jgi:hypothetical protein
MASMSLPTHPESDELAALRARAYGPDADIDGDPAALARLFELENSARGAGMRSAGTVGAAPEEAEAEGVSAARERTAPANWGENGIDRSGERTGNPVDGRGAASVSGDAAPASLSGRALADAGGESPHTGGDVPPVPGESGPAAHAGAEASASPGPTDGDAVATAESAPTRPWWRRRMPLLWTGSVIAAALVGAALALSVHAFGAGQVAVLSAQDESAWPEEMFSPRPPGGVVFEEFYGLTPLRIEQQFGLGAPMSECVYIVAEFGMQNGGCGAGSFPATAAILVGRDAPDELRERFEVGTALQFVLDGSQVRVYASAPAPDATP